MLSQLQEYQKTEQLSGVLVLSVAPDSPAAQGGLRSGDVIRLVEGKEITSAGEVQQSVEQSLEGEPLSVHVVRGQEHLDLSMLVKWTVPY
mmetsp:Transcript_9604/g.35205  ORF Transcript_9604/g.35205 Transcript_9604/m.35205 type:complete len:90 (+) Transcript_9604:1800-2069(+)